MTLSSRRARRLERFVEAKVYQPLDKSQIATGSNLDPTHPESVEGWDPDNKFGVPYMWGTIGLTYNVDMVKERLPNADLTSFDILFKPENAAKLADCGISILESPTDVVPMVLAYLGKDPNTTNPADFRAWSRPSSRSANTSRPSTPPTTSTPFPTRNCATSPSSGATPRGVQLLCAGRSKTWHVICSRRVHGRSALTSHAGGGAWADVAAALDRPASALVRLRQVHGHDTVLAADASREPGPSVGDIVIGCGPERVLAVQAADCVPLLVADRGTGAVAAAHAGWRGLAQAVPRIVVERLCGTFGADPRDLVAAIGPSIGACCYEVGTEVRDGFAAAGFGDERCRRWFGASAAVSAANPPMAGVKVAGRDGHWFFDAWQCARDQLVAAGLRSDAVFWAGLCTASHAQFVCSYRRDGATAGRIAGAIRSSAG